MWNKGGKRHTTASIPLTKGEKKRTFGPGGETPGYLDEKKRRGRDKRPNHTQRVGPGKRRRKMVKISLGGKKEGKLGNKRGGE